MKRKRILFLFIALAALVAFATGSGTSPVAAAEESGPTSFPEATEAEKDRLLTNRTGLVADAMESSEANRFVTIDAEELAAQLRTGSASLNLLPGVSTDFEVLRETTTGDSTSWVGVTADGGASAVVIRGDAVMANLQLSAGPISVTHVNGGFHIIHDHLQRPGQTEIEIPAPVEPPGPDGPLPPGVEYAAEDPIINLGSDLIGNEPLTRESRLRSAAQVAAGDISATAATNIDVMFVYDTSASTFYGSATAAENSMDLGIALANAGYVTSGIDLTLTRVHAEEINYTTSGSLSTDLNRVRERSDGFIDWVHGLRDEHDADLVALVVEHTGPGCGGIAGLLQTGTPTSATDQIAFQVTEGTCIPLTVFSHEIGHNLGATHDNPNAANPGAFPYSHGYFDVANNFRTVMSYANSNNGCTGCPRINQFSSPTVLYNGFATGDALHDNVLTLNTTRTGVAAYRPHPCPPPENDEFGARINLGTTYSAVISGTNICATRGSEAWYTNSVPVESVWYEWTAPATGTVTASTCSVNTDFDTDISVANGVSSSALFTYNNDAGAACAVNGNQSIRTWSATAGSTYSLKVDSPGSATGNYELTVSMPGGPASDDLVLLSSPCLAYNSTSADAHGLSGQMAAAATRTVQMTGTLADQGGAASCIPAGASAAVLSLTAVNPAGTGNLRISASGVAPEGGVVNYANNGLNNSNTVTVPLSAAGRVDVAANAAATDVQIAVIGYYAYSGTLEYTPLTPCAVADSRGTEGATGTFDGPFAAGAAYPDIDLVGTFNGNPAENQGGGNTDCGVPSGADAVMVNVVSVAGTGGAGGLAAGTGGTAPTVATTNFADIGLNNAASTIVPLSGETIAVDITAISGSPTTEVRVVVLGYFTTTGADYSPVNPCAVFDTRPAQSPTGVFAGKRVAGTATTYQITGTATTGQGGVSGGCAVPTGASAVLINLVAIDPARIGNLRAYATASTPTGGVVNFNSLTPVANNSNAVVVPLDGTGQLDLFVNAPTGGATPVVDVRGVVLGYYN